MTTNLGILHGIARGNVIELASDLGLPTGQPVTVMVQPLLTPEEALRQSFGGWAEDAEELDAFLEGLRRSREQARPEPLP